jgi:cyclomaltodextrinase / maltogenic alpha-amylase / neopullulanase
VQQLGADVLYLNPICLAYTNHKYDALDYLQVSPEYGTRDDVKALAEALHARGMKLVLDGVFNHMGRNAPIFREAEADPDSPYREWFVLRRAVPRRRPRLVAGREPARAEPREPGGARAHLCGCRLGRAQLPARRRGRLAAGCGFRHRLRGAGGAHRAAHAEKPGSLVVGEIANYPKEWYPSVDSVMHFILRHLTLRLANGQLDAATYGRMVTRLIDEAGIDNMLKSWIYLDNHDTPRLATVVPDGARAAGAGAAVHAARRAQPLLRQRARHDRRRRPRDARADALGSLVERRQPRTGLDEAADRAAPAAPRAARGRLPPDHVEPAVRLRAHTDRAADTVLVLVNPSDETVTETVMVANSKLMDSTRMVDLLDPASSEEIRLSAALLQVTLPPKAARVLKPDTAPPGGYTNYKRVQ